MTEGEKKVIKKLKTIKVSGGYGYIYNFEAAKILNLIRKKQAGIFLNLIQKRKEKIKLLKDQKQYVIDEYSETIEKKDKIINEMAKDKYKNISILEMAKIGQAIEYDPTKMFNGISDEEAINIIKQYFEKKVEEK